MKNVMYLAILFCSGILVFSCTKEEEPDPQPEAIDKFVASLTGEYQEWTCGNGGTGQKALSVENANLGIKKTGPESAEITCTLPALGEVFKCNATVQSDTSLLISAFELNGIMYDGIYVARASGGKFVDLYHPTITCTFLGRRVGNVAWTSN